MEDLEMGTLPAEDVKTIGQPEYRGKRVQSEHQDELADRINSQPSFGHVSKIEFGPNRGCKVCGIKELPYRAKHCRDCNRCVRKFDHHCFWIGGCVGELNHGKFWLFVFTQTWTFFWNIGIALTGYEARVSSYPNDD